MCFLSISRLNKQETDGGINRRLIFWYKYRIHSRALRKKLLITLSFLLLLSDVLFDAFIEDSALSAGNM